MTRRNIKQGQQSPSETAQNNTAMTDASQEANDNHEEANASGPSNTEILNAIRSLKKDFGQQSADMLEAINGIKGDLLSQSRRIGETEERISHAEEDVTTLQQKVKQLEGTTEMLRNKIQDQEDRARRSNLRLIGLPEKTEGPDMCSFLENWLPKLLGDTLTPSPVIERAHRVGQVNISRSSAPRPIVITFLNYKDRENTLKAARRQREVRYNDRRVSFFPDLSTETRQRQRLFDGVKAKLRALNIRYGLLYPAHLVITHDGRRRVFTSVSEAEDFLRNIPSQLSTGTPRDSPSSES